MRCDGARPACGQCLRANRGDDCEYSDGFGPTASQVLEQEVARLESRIAELESSTSTSLTLHDPYESFRRAQGRHLSTQSLQHHGQIPPHVSQTLMRYFFQHASEVGFFLHVPRFLQGVHNPPPSGHPIHMTVLLDIIYLLGAQFSNDSQLRAQQTGFLTRALQNLPSAMSRSNATAIIYVLQAEILLSYYFFDNSRSLEGAYHSNAAISIVFACKLHMIRSSRSLTVAANVAGGPEYPLRPPSDNIEEGERINAFWATFILDKCWAAARGSSSAFSDDESRGTQIDVPWPLDIARYENHPLPVNLRGMRTVQTFFNNASSDNGEQGIFSMLAKAAFLFERATRLASQWASADNAFQTRFLYLENRIEQFKQALPSIERVDPARLDVIRSLLLVHTLCHCATIKLHTPLDQNDITINSRTLQAAVSAVRVLQLVNVNGITYINPILANLWTTITQVIILGVRTSRSANTVGTSAPALPDQRMLLASMNLVQLAMERCAERSPSIRHQRTAIQQSLIGV
ncbi:hypothetical protein AcV5_009194 [Taiwanofungus camphoratus]|nr:hypothetical protein AcV5_009194 [Antrodia cinnamomea]KAI0924493.1 hypothetical protein AcW2_005368 [Antrodia cinnamomea]